MSDFPEGAPCWADVALPDLAAGKRFYGELFGWTFEEGSEAYGHYSQAFSDALPVAALAPTMPGQEQLPPAWMVYFASPDVRATDARIRDHGGTVLLPPMEVGEFGSMLVARDPAGVPFGVWQAGTHRGFGKQHAAGSASWIEVVTRDADATDAFFPAVFPVEVKVLMGPPGVDISIWNVGGHPVTGRFRVPPDAPEDVSSHTEIFFVVGDCDESVATAQRLGGRLINGPVDSPYGRYAAVADPQGAGFSVLDPTTTTGRLPDIV